MDDFSTETWQTGGRQYEASGLHSGTQKKKPNRYIYCTGAIITASWLQTAIVNQQKNIKGKKLLEKTFLPLKSGAHTVYIFEIDM